MDCNKEVSSDPGHRDISQRQNEGKAVPLVKNDEIVPDGWYGWFDLDVTACAGR